MEETPQLPRRMEAELERIYLHDDYAYVTVTIRVEDGRRFSLDFSRESKLARDLLEVVADALPALIGELHADEVMLTRIAPAADGEGDDAAESE